MFAMLKSHSQLPAPGSYGEQPAKLMRLIDIASMEAHKIEESENKKRQTK